jgi:hypothetical protein
MQHKGFSMSHPEKLYKYTSENLVLKILGNSRLRWSSPVLFNDISEFQIMPEFYPTLNDSIVTYLNILADAAFSKDNLKTDNLSIKTQVLLNLFQANAIAGIEKNELLESLIPNLKDYNTTMDTGLREHVSASINNARVLCVTTEFDNEVMWGNYANSHKGCVLGFRHLSNTPLLQAEAVSYTSQPPTIGAAIDFLLFGMTREMLSLSHKAICYTKKKSWSYENEWRAITWRFNEKTLFGDYLFFPEELESVTLGARTPLEIENKIRELVKEKYPTAEIYRMVIGKGQLARSKIQQL